MTFFRRALQILAAMDYSGHDYTWDRIHGLEREVGQLSDELAAAKSGKQIPSASLEPGESAEQPPSAQG